MTPVSGTRAGGSGRAEAAPPDTRFIKTSAPTKVAVLTEPFTVGVHAAMRGDIQIGDTVVIQGSGAIGLLTLIGAKLRGAGTLIVVGGPAERLQFAQRCGADVTIDIEQVTSVEERIELVKSHTPRGAGADVVLECSTCVAAAPTSKWGISSTWAPSTSTSTSS